MRLMIVALLIVLITLSGCIKGEAPGEEEVTIKFREAAPEPQEAPEIPEFTEEELKEKVYDDMPPVFITFGSYQEGPVLYINATVMDNDKVDYLSFVTPWETKNITCNKNKCKMLEQWNILERDIKHDTHLVNMVLYDMEGNSAKKKFSVVVKTLEDAPPNITHFELEDLTNLVLIRVVAEDDAGIRNIHVIDRIDRINEKKDCEKKTICEAGWYMYKDKPFRVTVEDTKGQFAVRNFDPRADQYS